MSVGFVSSSLNPHLCCMHEKERERTKAMIISAPKELCARQNAFIYMYLILFA